MGALETGTTMMKLKVKVKSLSCVQLFSTLWSVVYQAPPSMGILQARILEWVAISFSRRSSRPRDQTHLESRFFTTLPLSCLESRFFTTKLPRKPLELLLPLMETSTGLERNFIRPCLGCQEQGCSQSNTHPQTTHVFGRESWGEWARAQAELTDTRGTELPGYPA